MPLKTLGRRLASVVCLIAIDIAGLVIGLYAALALRSLIFDPKPILWGLLWDHETSWLAFLILLLVLVFWQAGLYAPRETREGGRHASCRACSSSRRSHSRLRSAPGSTSRRSASTSSPRRSSPLLIGLFRASYEILTGYLLARSRRAPQGDARRRRRRSAHSSARLLGASRGGIDYEFVDGVSSPEPSVEALARDASRSTRSSSRTPGSRARLLEIVEARTVAA